MAHAAAACTVMASSLSSANLALLTSLHYDDYDDPEGANSPMGSPLSATTTSILKKSTWRVEPPPIGSPMWGFQFEDEQPSYRSERDRDGTQSCRTTGVGRGSGASTDESSRSMEDLQTEQKERLEPLLQKYATTTRKPPALNRQELKQFLWSIDSVFEPSDTEVGFIMRLCNRSRNGLINLEELMFVDEAWRVYTKWAFGHNPQGLLQQFCNSHRCSLSTADGSIQSEGPKSISKGSSNSYNNSSSSTSYNSSSNSNSESAGALPDEDCEHLALTLEQLQQYLTWLSGGLRDASIMDARWVAKAIHPDILKRGEATPVAAENIVVLRGCKELVLATTAYHVRLRYLARASAGSKACCIL